MKCPFCGASDTKVTDSRESAESFEVRRRRECETCHKRFTTYERVEQHPLVVIKKDGRREEFSYQKITDGISRACQKRDVSTEKIKEICSEIETALLGETKSEVPSSLIGEMVMNRLQKTDKVAYIRFASIYKDFETVNDFQKEIKSIAKQ